MSKVLDEAICRALAENPFEDILAGMERERRQREDLAIASTDLKPGDVVSKILDDDEPREKTHVWCQIGRPYIKVCVDCGMTDTISEEDYYIGQARARKQYPTHTYSRAGIIHVGGPVPKCEKEWPAEGDGFGNDLVRPAQITTKRLGKLLVTVQRKP